MAYADDGERLLADPVLGGEVVGRVAVAIVDGGLRDKLLDVDGVGALNGDVGELVVLELMGRGSGALSFTEASGMSLPLLAASSSRGRWIWYPAITPLIRSCGPRRGISATADETSTIESPRTTPSL